MPVLGIKFKSDGKIYNFYSEENYSKGTKVLAETERGIQLGVVENSIDSPADGLKNVKSIATEADYAKYLNNLKDAQNILVETKDLIKKLKLNMNLIDASFSLDRKQLLLNFVSDERVDFRNLVKEMASKYHTRIELHQIGVRDKAKEIGGLGLCGRVLCCHSCLKNINTININMVKNQDIALNPTKINGACGRLLCCFTYENELYEIGRKALPKIGQKVIKDAKEGEVIKLDLLRKRYTIKFDENTYEEVVIDDGDK